MDVVKLPAEKADYIEEGSMLHTHVHPETDSHISAVTRPTGRRSASITSLYVPEEHRGKGIGKLLLNSMMNEFPSIQGQVSSKAAAKNAYKSGRRLAGNESASLEDVYKKIDEDSSANMWTHKSNGGDVERFHGTDVHDLQKFDPETSRTAKYHYLADEPETAQSYGKHVYRVKLKPKNMILFHPENIGPKQMKVIHELSERLGEDPDHLLNAITSADGSFYGSRGSLQDRVMDELKDMGHDAVRFPDMAPGGGWDMSTVVLDNNIVHSIDKNGADIHKADGGDVDGITAYHGSPHDFDEFDTSKIGTGEGAQAYGHGLYFAEHEPVAKGYRDQLSEGSTHVMFPEGDKDEWGNPIRFHPEELTGHESAAAKAVLNREGNKGQLEWLKNSPIERDEAAKAMRLIRSGEIEKAPAGHMYEVHINAHPHHMLDWDKDVSEQHPHVLNAINKMIPKDEEHRGGLQEFVANPDDYAGGAIIDYLHSAYGTKKTSEMLHGAGIKGIKYLDAGSRSDESKQTHNYVVFDHNDVRVKRKYEQGGAVNGYEGGGEVDDIPDIKNPISVFPKPQRMFPEENRPAGGQYLNAKTKEDMTGHKAAQASIGVQPGGRPFFNASADAVEQTGSHGKGNATAKTNLFKQKAGWKWVDAPEGHEDTGTIVSVEHRGHHHYALNAHFPKGVDLARYENSTSEPRLRPTTKGNVTKVDQVGTISVRGKEHPVYNHVIVKAGGGPIVKRALELLSKDRTGR